MSTSRNIMNICKHICSQSTPKYNNSMQNTYYVNDSNPTNHYNTYNNNRKYRKVQSSLSTYYSTAGPNYINSKPSTTTSTTHTPSQITIHIPVKHTRTHISNSIDTFPTESPPSSTPSRTHSTHHHHLMHYLN